MQNNKRLFALISLVWKHNGSFIIICYSQLLAITSLPPPRKSFWKWLKSQHVFFPQSFQIVPVSAIYSLMYSTQQSMSSLLVQRTMKILYCTLENVSGKFCVVVSKCFEILVKLYEYCQIYPGLFCILYLKFFF